MVAIKLFRGVQTYFKMLGFYPPSQPNQMCSFNRRNGFYFVTVSGMCILTTRFVFLEASSAYEYANSFYVLNTMLTMSVYFTVFYFKMGSVLTLIENYQQWIDKRECEFDYYLLAYIFNNTILMNEKFNHIFHFFLYAQRNTIQTNDSIQLHGTERKSRTALRMDLLHSGQSNCAGADFTALSAIGR